MLGNEILEIKFTCNATAFFYLSGRLVKQGCIYRHPLGTVPHKVRFEKLWRLISGYKAG